MSENVEKPSYLGQQNETTWFHHGAKANQCLEESLETFDPPRGEMRALWHDCMLPKNHSGSHKCPCGLTWEKGEAVE